MKATVNNSIVIDGEINIFYLPLLPDYLTAGQEVIKLNIIIIIINGLVYDLHLRLYIAGIVKLLPEPNRPTDF